MVQTDAAPASRQRIFASRDPEETRAFMRGVEFHLDLEPREVSAFDFSTHALYLPNSYIGYVQYGSAVTVRVPADRRRDDYFVHLPLRGSCDVVNHAGVVACTPERGVVSSPTGHVTRSERGSARLTLSLTKSAMIGHMEALLAEAVPRPIEFTPAIDLGSAEGRRLARQVKLATAELDDPSAPVSPILLGMYEQLIMTGLMLAQPNNYSAALARLNSMAGPRDVKRALDYMQAHLNSPLTLADIVAASGVPGRTLLAHFKARHGMSPMRYLRNARLARVHEALLRAETEASVTEIAMGFGFNHLGRFAIEYRRRFGESPSQTCRRARRLA